MSKNLGKWIGNDEINGSKIRLNNNEYMRSRNAANSADLDMIRGNSSDKAEFGIEPVYNGNPTTAQSLVNRQYVLDAIEGIRDPKDAVQYASTAALPTNTPAGAGVGKTLTADANGALVLDGHTFTSGDVGLRVAVLFDGIHNGIYTLTQEGDGGTPWILTRATDSDEDVEVTNGLSFDVVNGLAYGQTRWLLTTADPITVDTTALTFIKVPRPDTVVQFKKEKITLNGTDISNGYVDLANNAEIGSVLVTPKGGPLQDEGVDYVLSVVSDVTRITFAGDLSANLVDTDILIINYAHFN